MPIPPSRELQQPTALRPFMREFVAFAIIAFRAGGNNVRYVVGSPSGKRNHVVSMPYEVFVMMVLMAIVATIVLPLQLLKELLGSKRVASIMRSNPTLMVRSLSCHFSFFTSLIRLGNLFAMIRLSILNIICFGFFRMVVIPTFRGSIAFLSMALIIFSPILQPFFLVNLFPLRIILAFLFPVGLIPGFILFAGTCFAYTPKLLSLLAKELRCIREKTLARASALLLRDILGYSVHAVRVPFLSSRPWDGDTSARAQTSVLYLQLYHKTAPQASSHAFYCPLYIPLEV